MRAVYDKNGKSMVRLPRIFSISLMMELGCRPTRKDLALTMLPVSLRTSLVASGLRTTYVLHQVTPFTTTDPKFQIGEISLMKEMTNVASTVMTDEEKAALDREVKASQASSPGGATPTNPPLDQVPATFSNAAPEEKAAPADGSTHAPTPSRPQSAVPDSHGLHVSPAASPAPSPSTSPAPPDPSKISASSDDLRRKKGKQKLTPEQRQKLEELEAERRKAIEERVKILTQKLIERVRPFVEAAHPGDPNDPETIAFMKKMQLEADDLKLESFGVEVSPWFVVTPCWTKRLFQLLHTIGTAYATKATSFMKSRKFFGM